MLTLHETPTLAPSFSDVSLRMDITGKTFTPTMRSAFAPEFWSGGTQVGVDRAYQLAAVDSHASVEPEIARRLPRIMAAAIRNGAVFTLRG